MENYTKGRNVEEPFERENVPIAGLPADYVWMLVRGGTKIENVLDYALGMFRDKGARCVVWSASGGGVGKAITCAEKMKREHNGTMHQITKICYTNLQEFWDPKLDELDPLVVTRRVPAVHIALCLDPLDTTELGYQSPNDVNVFWKGNSKAEPNKKQHKPQGRENRSRPASQGVTSEFAAMGLRSDSQKRPRNTSNHRQQNKKPTGSRNKDATSSSLPTTTK